MEWIEDVGDCAPTEMHHENHNPHRNKIPTFIWPSHEEELLLASFPAPSHHTRQGSLQPGRLLGGLSREVLSPQLFIPRLAWT